MGVYRSRLMNAYEKMMEGISSQRKKSMEGQLSIFDMALNTEDGKKDEKHQLYPEDEDIYPDIPEYSQKILLSMEKEMLGLIYRDIL